MLEYTKCRDCVRGKRAEVGHLGPELSVLLSSVETCPPMGFQLGTAPCSCFESNDAACPPHDLRLCGRPTARPASSFMTRGFVAHCVLDLPIM